MTFQHIRIENKLNDVFMRQVNASIGVLMQCIRVDGDRHSEPNSVVIVVIQRSQNTFSLGQRATGVSSRLGNGTGV